MDIFIIEMYNKKQLLNYAIIIKTKVILPHT
jgi:hypothetical protein